MDKEPTNKEILEAINAFSAENDQHLQKIESGMGSIKSEMVTKDYLDDKLIDLKGDLVVIIRKEDTKLRALVEILEKRKVITNEDKKQILTMQPFPQLFV